MQIFLALVAALAPMPCYVPPVAEPVVVPFDQPACDYCPGHRGLEYDVAQSTAVHAVFAGTVTFSGPVVGTRYVVVLQDDGLTATYGRLSTGGVRAGDRVRAGQEVGTAAGRLYFGLRRGEEYLDPAPLLGAPRHRVRLVPSAGGRGRPSPTAPPRCSGVAGTPPKSR